MVRPWTYTGGREEAYTFSHYGLPMGSELGPDSRTLRARLAWRILPGVEASLDGFVLQKGVDHQATLGFVNRDDGKTAELFGNGWTGRSGGKFGARWTAFRDADFLLSGSWVSQEDVDGSSEDVLIFGYGWDVDW